jgi:hypothetical protein
MRAPVTRSCCAAIRVIADYLAALERGGRVRDEDVEEGSGG